MNSTKKTARIAGVLYLVNGVTGFFSIIYVPSKLFVSGNAAATAQNILASERLLRLGITSEVICAVEYIYLLWVLYRLLNGVSRVESHGPSAENKAVTGGTFMKFRRPQALRDRVERPS